MKHDRHFWGGFEVVLELLIWTLISHCIPFFFFFTFYEAFLCKCMCSDTVSGLEGQLMPPVSLHIISDADITATAKPLDDHVQHLLWGILRLKRCVPNRIFLFYFSSSHNLNMDSVVLNHALPFCTYCKWRFELPLFLFLLLLFWITNRWLKTA